MGCSQPAAHLPIHHVILVVDVAREVGSHELVLIPAPSCSSGKSPLTKLAKRWSNKLTVTQGNYMTRQAVKTQLLHKPALLAQPTDSVLRLSPHLLPLPTSASPLAAVNQAPCTCKPMALKCQRWLYLSQSCWKEKHRRVADYDGDLTSVGKVLQCMPYLKV